MYPGRTLKGLVGVGGLEPPTSPFVIFEVTLRRSQSLQTKESAE
jgi:hypothetical protein